MVDDASPSSAASGSGIDTSVPHSARFWNYLLGGKDNYQVDREVGDAVRQQFPRLVAVARESRAFLGRAVHHLVAQEGIRQFLDIGTGLPTADNTHEIAQRHAPGSRVVYADNDQLVLTHARALLTSSAEGETTYLDADVREPEAILRRAADTLDFDRPIALILMGIMGHIPDAEDANMVIRRLVEALPSGSALVYYDGTNTHPHMTQAMHHYADSGATPYYVRTPDQIRAVFDGLELIEPGVVPVTRWNPDRSEAQSDVDGYGGVARKTTS